jgi:hypothetical protein
LAPLHFDRETDAGLELSEYGLAQLVELARLSESKEQCIDALSLFSCNGKVGSRELLARELCIFRLLFGVSGATTRLPHKRRHGWRSVAERCYL